MASGRLHVVVTDALSLDNGVARLRVLIAAEPSNPPDLSAVLASYAVSAIAYTSILSAETLARFLADAMSCRATAL